MKEKKALKEKLHKCSESLKQFLNKELLSKEDKKLLKKTITEINQYSEILLELYDFDFSLFSILENKQFSRIPTKLVLTRNYN